MNSEKLFSLILGTVTSDGLLVGESLFSSPMMVKQKWFERANQIGIWSIP